MNVHPVIFLLKKFHYLCLSFLEDNSFVDWLVKERLVANKLKEKRKKNLASKGNCGKKSGEIKVVDLYESINSPLITLHVNNL